MELTHFILHSLLRSPSNFEEYLLTVDDSHKEPIMEIHDLICSVLPHAKEKISFAMPTWWDQHNLIHLAAMKNHLGIYPGAEGTSHFAKRLEELGYKYSKGAIQIPYRKPLPIELIREIAIWCGEHNSSK